MSDKGWFVMGKLKSKKRGLPNMRGSHTLVKIKIHLIDISKYFTLLKLISVKINKRRGVLKRHGGGKISENQLAGHTEE